MLDGHPVARLHRSARVVGAGRLHSVDTGARPGRRCAECGPGGEAAPTDRHDDRLDAGVRVLERLEHPCSLPRDGDRMVVWRDVNEPLRSGYLGRRAIPHVVRTGLDHDAGTVALDGCALRWGDPVGHDDRRRDPAESRRPRHGLAVIPAGRGHHAGRRRTVLQQRPHLVGGAPRLVGTDLLQVLGLHEHRAPARPVDRPAREQGRVVHERPHPLGGGEDVLRRGRIERGRRGHRRHATRQRCPAKAPSRDQCARCTATCERYRNVPPTSR